MSVLAALRRGIPTLPAARGRELSQRLIDQELDRARLRGMLELPDGGRVADEVIDQLPDEVVDQLSRRRSHGARARWAWWAAGAVEQRGRWRS